MGLSKRSLHLNFLKYVSVVRTGILVPSEVDKEIVRKVPRPNFKAILLKLARSYPRAYFRALLPKSSEYTQLIKEKKRLGKRFKSRWLGSDITAIRSESWCNW